MGQVFRARDTTLGRDVALKVLPDAFASDPDRLARFTREAQTLAALNHPNIAHIHGLEESGGVRALVMELVEGDDLAQRIARGAIPIEDALPIAAQIAEGLEAAHEQGIIHRDLKPANVKVRPDGTVKVLDFGLAKAMEPTGAAAVKNSLAPTITTPAMTQAGMILGTAAYMSPEQAKGRPVDRRADIWAFGAVLYEMLTGRRAFAGDDVSEVLASVLAREPDWTRLPAALSPALGTCIRRCLDKNPGRRWHCASDLRIELEAIAAAPRRAPEAAVEAGLVVPARTRRFRLALVAAGSLAAGVLAAVLVMGSQAPPEPQSVRFEISAPDKARFESGLPGSGPAAFNAGSLSPDGRGIAFAARDETGQVLLWVRALDDVTARALPGTEGAGLPFWSPDSRAIAFFTPGKLKRIDPTGGPAQTICDAASGRGGAWNREGVIVFAPGNATPLLRVSASGGDPSPVTTLKPGEAGHRFPSFLPDGRRFLYLRELSDGDVTTVMVGSLDAGESTELMAADSPAVYASPGSVLFVRQGTLLARAFDATRLEFMGEPIPIAEQVTFDGSGRGFSVSDEGTLAYRVGSNDARKHLTWVDRNGAVVQSVGIPALYQSPAISPDGRSVALHRHEGTGGDIWVMDANGGKLSRLTFDASQENANPLWSADGTQIVFGSRRNNKWGLYRKPSNGTGREELLFESDLMKVPMSVSATGMVLFYVEAAKGGRDVWALPCPATESRCRSSRPSSARDIRRFHQTGDGLPTRRMRPAERKSTCRRFRPEAASGRCPAAAEPLPGGALTARNSSTWKEPASAGSSGWTFAPPARPSSSRILGRCSIPGI